MSTDLEIIAFQEGRIAELEDSLQFVERWAVHHGTKSNMTAENALSMIQHYPPISTITKSYADGKVPDTFNPYSRITELEAQLADAKQAARQCSDLASQALADLEPYRKDAERYQWLCDKGHNYHGAMAGTGSMSLCRGPYILLEPPSHNKFSNMVLGKPAADAIIDAAIAEGKA